MRRELSRAVVTNGWGLLELRPRQMSLEDIFLQLTTDETAADEAHPVTLTPEPEANAGEEDGVDE